jgi:hypothetical protein
MTQTDALGDEARLLLLVAIVVDERRHFLIM